MAADRGLIEWTAEAMAPLGLVTSRAMMGAAVLYCDGVVFAVADADSLWFKADAESDATWDEAGCARFVVEEKDGRALTMNYRRAPDEVYDDADSLRDWAVLALQAGQRAAAKKKPKRPPAGASTR